MQQLSRCLLASFVVKSSGNLQKRKMSIKTVLIDLSGTLHVEDTATPNAAEGLQRLRDASLNIKFVTNTTKESRRCLKERLVRLGFKVSTKEIFTSLNAARSIVVREKYRNPMLLLEQDALEDFNGVPRYDGKGDADAVVVGLSPSLFNYTQLNAAFRHLINGAPLIAIHKSRYFAEGDGLSLGPGPFVEGLEYAAECKARVVGKPEPLFFEAALKGTDPNACVMVGDDVRYDIAGAQACGIRGILVQTGKYRTGDESRINPSPFATCPTFADAVVQILRM